MNSQLSKGIILSIVTIVCAIMYSCTSDKSNDGFYLDKSIKSNAKSLQTDTVGFFEELIYARNFFVYQDSILIVHNRKYEGVYFLEVYDLRSEKLLAQLFRWGNGPNEMLSARIDLNGNILTVNDYVKAQVAFVNMDSILQIRHTQVLLSGITHNHRQLSGIKEINY